MKKLISILLIIQLIMFCPIIVNALSYTATLSTESSELKAGETVSINMKLSNIDMSSGIMALSAKLIYDENVFEPITVNTLGGIVSSSLSKMSGLNGWGSISYSPVTKIFAMDASNFMTESDDVLQILLKVKADNTATKTTVEIKDIEASNGEEDVKADNVSITIGREGGGDNPTPPAENNTPSGNTPANNTPSNNTPSSNTHGSNSSRNNIIDIGSGGNSNKSKTNTLSNKSKSGGSSGGGSSSSSGGSPTGTNGSNNLPKTGTTSTIVTIIIILVAVSGISYKRYNDMKNIK